MAATKPEALVLRGVSVLGDGKAAGLRCGFYAANEQMPMVPLSMRHPSPGCREDRTEPPQQQIRRVANAADCSAVRAGRPGSPAGVLGSRGSARIAGRAVLLGWPIVVGTTPPAQGARFPGRLLPFATPYHATSGLIRQVVWPGRMQGVNQADVKPARWTLAISTWGSGD